VGLYHNMIQDGVAIDENIACEQALKLNWEPASMTNEFEYLRLKSWREILIGQML
jgi:hypothetical protein